MQITTTVAGTLVSAVKSSYEFTDDAGKQVKGDSRSVVVVAEFGQAPVTVKVGARDAAAFDALESAGFGSQVTLGCSVFAKGLRGGGAVSELRLLSCVIDAAANAPKKRQAA